MSVEFCLKLPRPASFVNGVKTLEYRAADSRGTVILIHGLTGSPAEMRYPAKFLHQRGFSVICPVLARHGEPLHVLKGARWEEFYQSVRETLAGIPAEEPVFAAGLSMGALLALLLAEEFPERIKAVTCFSPTLFFDGWNSPWTRHFLPLLEHTPFKHFLYFKEEPPYGIKNERIRGRVRDCYKGASLQDAFDVAKFGYPFFPVTSFCELRRLIRHLKKKLPEVRVPVQLVQAYDDDMTSIKNSQYIAARVRSKLKEIVFLYNSYHVVTADQERDYAAEKMYEFFSRFYSINPLSRLVTAAAANKTGEVLQNAPRMR